MALRQRQFGMIFAPQPQGLQDSTRRFNAGSSWNLAATDTVAGNTSGRRQQAESVEDWSHQLTLAPQELSYLGP
jgi:hypothetical protein